MGKGKMPVQKRSFLKNVGLPLGAREKILDSFNSKIFPTKNFEHPNKNYWLHLHKKEQAKISNFNLYADLIVKDETNINTEIFIGYFGYKNPSFLLRYLYNSKGSINEKIVNSVNALIDLRNAVQKKEIPNNENLEKVIDIVEEIFNFDKQQKGKGLRLNFDCANLEILSPKQTLKRLPIALPNVQADNTSENLLSETLQIIYSLY